MIYGIISCILLGISISITCMEKGKEAADEAQLTVDTFHLFPSKKVIEKLSIYNESDDYEYTSIQKNFFPKRSKSSNYQECLKAEIRKYKLNQPYLVALAAEYSCYLDRLPLSVYTSPLSISTYYAHILAVKAIQSILPSGISVDTVYAKPPQGFEDLFLKEEDGFTCWNPIIIQIHTKRMVSLATLLNKPEIISINDLSEKERLDITFLDCPTIDANIAADNDIDPMKDIADKSISLEQVKEIIISEPCTEETYKNKELNDHVELRKGAFLMGFNICPEKNADGKRYFFYENFYATALLVRPLARTARLYLQKPNLYTDEIQEKATTYQAPLHAQIATYTFPKILDEKLKKSLKAIKNKEIEKSIRSTSLSWNTDKNNVHESNAHQFFEEYQQNQSTENQSSMLSSYAANIQTQFQESSSLSMDALLQKSITAFSLYNAEVRRVEKVYELYQKQNQNKWHTSYQEGASYIKWFMSFFIVSLGLTMRFYSKNLSFTKAGILGASWLLTIIGSTKISNFFRDKARLYKQQSDELKQCIDSLKTLDDF